MERNFQFFKNNIKQTKPLWKRFNNLYKNKEGDIDSNLIKNFKYIEKPNEIADIINNFQKEQVGQLRKEKKVTYVKKDYLKKESNKNTITVRKIKHNQVKNYIQELSKSKATGYDNISIRHIKDSIENSSRMITRLINEIIEQEKIPEKMKIQVLRPIFKSGTKDDPANYRPIALLSVIEKILEKHFHDIIYCFFRKYKLLKANQYAYQRNKGVNDILNKINIEFNKQIADGIKIGIIFFDLCKAFDVIDRTLLLNKLEKYGIRGKMNNLLRSYFTNRKICTRIKNENSELANSEYGVPQGSCLGPLLFIIYLNDILNIDLNGEMMIFADDIMLFYCHVNKRTIGKKLTADVKEIVKWTNNNSVFLNEDKTKIMWLKNYKTKDTQKIEIKLEGEESTKENKVKNNNDNKIGEVAYFKYLGMIIDKHLQWNNHIEKVKNKLREILLKLNQLKGYLPHEMAKIIYNALVLSTLNYGIECYAHASNYQLEAIEKLNKNIIKTLINNKNRDLTKEKEYEMLGALPVKQLLIKAIIKRTIYNENMEKYIYINTSIPLDYNY